MSNDLNKLLGITPKPYTNPFPMVKKTEPEKTVKQPEVIGLTSDTSKTKGLVDATKIRGLSSTRSTNDEEVLMQKPVVGDKAKVAKVAKTVVKAIKKSPATVKVNKDVKNKATKVATTILTPKKKSGANTAAVMKKAMDMTIAQTKPPKKAAPTGPKTAKVVAEKLVKETLVKNGVTIKPVMKKATKVKTASPKKKK